MNSEVKRNHGKSVQACRKRTDFGLAAGLAFYALSPMGDDTLGGEKVTIPLDQEETPVENETDTKDQGKHRRKRFSIRI